MTPALQPQVDAASTLELYSLARYMLAMDNKQLGYSVLIQIVLARTAEGFVPNGSAERPGPRSEYV